MASSGLIPVLGSFPLKKSLTNYLTLGILVDPPTNTISSIWFFLKPESSRAVWTGPMVFLNKSELSSSNLALVKTSEKSTPSYKDSISILASWVEDNCLLAFSTSLLSFYKALLSEEISTLFFLLIYLMKYSMTLWSKSCPPKWVSPLVETTSNTPLSMVNTDTSKVPPPKSKTMMFFSPCFLSKP